MTERHQLFILHQSFSKDGSPQNGQFPFGVPSAHNTIVLSFDILRAGRGPRVCQSQHLRRVLVCFSESHELVCGYPIARPYKASERLQELQTVCSPQVSLRAMGGTGRYQCYQLTFSELRHTSQVSPTLGPWAAMGASNRKTWDCEAGAPQGQQSPREATKTAYLSLNGAWAGVFSGTGLRQVACWVPRELGQLVVTIPPLHAAKRCSG